MKEKNRHWRSIVSVLAVAMLLLGTMVFLVCFQEPAGAAETTPQTVIAWGLDDSGDIDNTPAGNDYVAIAAGATHSLALKSDGSLVAWGNNIQDQCNVPAGNDYEAVAAGYYHSLALKSDGTVVAWGSNDDGQCNVPAGQDYVAISAGEAHSSALRANGTLATWGANDYGQCTRSPPGTTLWPSPRATITAWPSGPTAPWPPGE